MKKSWIYGTIAGIALIATACGPNYGTKSYPNNGLQTQNVGDGAYNRGTDMTDNNRLTSGYPGPGFNTAGNMNDSIYKQRGTTTSGMDTRNAANHIGFVRMDRNYLRSASDTVNNIYVDRDALAKVVGNVTASVPGVSTSTILVTDEEVFVGLNTDGKNVSQTKEKARMSAQSVCPRYFKVYVSDNQSMINEMNRVANRSSYTNAVSPNSDQHIDRLIKSFGGTPDGEDMGKGMNMGTRNIGTTSR